MIIIDFNNVAISTYLISGGIHNQPMDRDYSTEDLLRHMILTAIQSHRNRCRKRFGSETVIACDSRSWRKSAYKYYKYKRHSGRQESAIDWDTIYNTIEKLILEIDQYLPWKVIRVDNAEADDIIGTLCLNTPGNIAIISPDKDFVQLQRFNPGIEQWSPQKKKWVNEKDVERFYRELIIRGDGGDGIPNILSADDTFAVDGKRQTPISKKKLAILIENWSNIKDYLTEEQQKYFDRNLLCIDLTKIPESITKEILEQYRSSENKVPTSPLLKMKAQNQFLKYLMENRCNNLMKKANEYLQ